MGVTTVRVPSAVTLVVARLFRQGFGVAPGLHSHTVADAAAVVVLLPATVVADAAEVGGAVVAACSVPLLLEQPATRSAIPTNRVKRRMVVPPRTIRAVVNHPRASRCGHRRSPVVRGGFAPQPGAVWSGPLPSAGMGASHVSRRRVLQGIGAGAAVSMVGGMPAWGSPSGHRLVLPPGTRPDPTKPEGADLLPEIEHIVIYMQENHSYDNYFGMLGRGDGFTLGGDGLPTNSQPRRRRQPRPVFHMHRARADLHRRREPVVERQPRVVERRRMDGFVTAADGGTGAMGYWDGTDLPFYYGLANTFPLCDRWFCSVLGQTFPNRRYLQAATSVGIVSTDVNEVLGHPRRAQRHHLGPAQRPRHQLERLRLRPARHRCCSRRLQRQQDKVEDVRRVPRRLRERHAAAGAASSAPAPRPTARRTRPTSSSARRTARRSSTRCMQSPAWEKTAVLHLRRARRLLRPRAAARGVRARRHRAADPAPPTQPGAFDRYGVRVPAFVDLAVRQDATTCRTSCTTTRRCSSSSRPSSTSAR